MTLAMAQLAGRNSLRDIVENISAQSHRRYHPGSAKLTRSSLSGINEDKPYALYEALFGKLLNRCQTMAPGHDFRFDNPLYSLDASTIDEAGRALEFPRGSMVAIDRGYNNYAGYNQLTDRGIFFVTRPKSNAQTRVVSRRPVMSG